ncbi:MAG: hypothetical protein QXX41_09025 [Nitrososphaerota archaeon]
MRDKGQFSIIAASLVAVVLISTVIITYSTIRNFPTGEQPKVLNAIDETNFALKQILGFTLGYYGSVLQVTGEREYAYNLSYKYLASGLNYIARAHPDWAASFNVTRNDLNLETCWFTRQSYSRANITVKYNLTGLGIYGITYTTSCKLSLNILETKGNKAHIRVTADENDEPVINLGKNNFKFYLYKYANLTWVTASPSTEPIALADGRYIIDIPPEVVDPNSYIVQVQDSRGIVTVASSYSRYICELTWGLSFESTRNDYVDNISNVDGSPDKGTHSNFTAQQYGPDGVYDTLMEIASGSYLQNYYPSGYSPLGSTTCVSGTVANLQNDDGVYMQLRSYPSAYSPTQYSTISFDRASSTILTSQGSSMSWQHTTGTGDDRILLVTVDIFRSNGAPTTITNVTYDGIPLTQVATALCSTDPQVRSYVFLLVNPPSGTKTVKVDFASPTLAIGGSVTYANVNQTNPIIAYNTNTGSGTSQSVSLTASGSYSKMLYGHLATYRTNSYDVIEGSGQANRWAQTSQNHKGRGSDKSVTSGSVTMFWSTSKAVSWVAIAVLLQPTKLPVEYTCEAEFSGSSNTFNWERLNWAIDSSATTVGVGITFQLYNYALGTYPTSGDGYLTATIGTSDATISQVITLNPTNFRSSTGQWKFKLKAVKATSTRFDIKIDLAKFSPEITNYALDLEEQWINVNYQIPFQYLCIKTGELGSENLAVDVRSGSTWVTVINSLKPNTWNNVSVTSYISSPVFTIRFRGSADVSDPVQDSWEIDAVLLSSQPMMSLISSLRDTTFVVELLQNGTMRWLGQNLQLTTQALPIPPVPIKAIHVNQTINGVDREVPFQIEDWASDYRVPLSLANNASVFSNRNMIVFLVNPNVSKVTIWWNGSDTAKQTPLAYTNKYFTVTTNPSNRTISNTIVTLKLSFSDSSPDFKIISTRGESTSTAVLMRINQKVADYGHSEPMYAITNGPVRVVLHHEVEWPNGGVPGCPNVYAHIVLTLPANATYYTYQLRLMFINSTQTRTITDLCLIKLSFTGGQPKTENGTLGGYPIVTNTTGLFFNYSATCWQHHWSQLNSSLRGAGIIFTDSANKMLYVFDAIAGGKTGALKVASGTIELCPVTSMRQVSFKYPLDLIWYGAVVTFDETTTTPIYKEVDGQPTGLWVFVEYPPVVTVTTES